MKMMIALFTFLTLNNSFALEGYVQDWIKSKSAGNLKESAALLQYGKTLSQIVKQHNDRDKSILNFKSNVRALNCLEYVMGDQKARIRKDQLKTMVLSKQDNVMGYLKASDHASESNFDLKSPQPSDCD